MLFLSHALSRQPSTIDTCDKMLMLFFFVVSFHLKGGWEGEGSKWNTEVKEKTKTIQHPAFFFHFFLFFLVTNAFFSCMSNADMEKGGGGGGGGC